jgi:hypothetical protein
MPLTIEDYNRAEEEGAVGLSFPEIMACSPETFNLVGFRPTSSATSSSHPTSTGTAIRAISAISSVIFASADRVSGRPSPVTKRR